MLPGMEVIDSIRTIKIDEAPREVEQTPSEPILPPQLSGNYNVDESVKACEVGSSSIARM